MAARPGRAHRRPVVHGAGPHRRLAAADLPRGVLVGGAAAENHDLERVLSARTPLVIGVVLGLGFLLLLVALQAPLVAALGVVTNLLASAKEHWDASGGNARDAIVGGVAHSGRVIFAAAGVMVAVFFTFALSGPLPPRKWESCSAWPCSSTRCSSACSCCPCCSASPNAPPGPAPRGCNGPCPACGSGTAPTHTPPHRTRRPRGR